MLKTKMKAKWNQCLSSMLVLFSFLVLLSCNSVNESPVVRHESVKEASAISDKIQTGTITDARDGTEYKWIRYDEGKRWLAQNLNYKSQNSWCYKNEIGCENFGRLYSFSAAKQSCPEGWHLASLEEWNTLISYYDDSKEAYKKLVTDDTTEGAGFGINLGGVRNANKEFDFLNENGNYWTSTSSKKGKNWSINFSKSIEDIFTLAENKKLAMSCRCVEGKSEEPVLAVVNKSKGETNTIRESSSSIKKSKTHTSHIANNPTSSGLIVFEAYDEATESFKSMDWSSKTFAGDMVINKPNKNSKSEMTRFISNKSYASPTEYRINISGNPKAYVFSLEADNKVYGFYPLEGSPGRLALNTNKASSISGDMIVSKPNGRNEAPRISSRTTSNKITVVEELRQTKNEEETKIVLLANTPLDIKGILKQMEQLSNPSNPEERLLHILSSRGLKWQNSTTRKQGDSVLYSLEKEKFSILPLVFVIKRFD